MDKRQRKNGLVIIAAEVQKSSNAAIKKIIKDHKIKFTVTKGANRPVNFSGIPFAVVFDSQGKLIYSGHPNAEKFERSIKKALKELKKNGGIPEKDDPIDTPDKPNTPLVSEQDWTNNEDKTIQASVLSLDNDKVMFKLSNGKTVAYPLEKLSEVDQATIRTAHEKSLSEAPLSEAKD